MEGGRLLVVVVDVTVKVLKLLDQTGREFHTGLLSEAVLRQRRTEVIYTYATVRRTQGVKSV
jgi:hypothetical protein